MTAALSWQAEDVLRILDKSNLRPGKSLPVKTLWQRMGSGKDVRAGIRSPCHLNTLNSMPRKRT